MSSSAAHSRAKHILLHVVLAGFAAPALLLYMATGILYTFGTKGSYEVTKSALEVPAGRDVASPDLDTLEAFTRSALTEAGRPLPSGESGLKRVGTSWQFEWTGTAADTTVSPTAAGGLELAYKKTTPWRHLVQLHKAKGGAAFHYLSAAMVIALFGMLFMGYRMGWVVPRYRRALFLATGTGVAATLLAAWLS